MDDEALLLRDGVREFVEVFLPAQFRTVDTRDAYGGDIRLLVEFLAERGVGVWQEVGVKDLQLFLIDMEHRKLTLASQRRRVQAIKAFFGFLVAYKYIPKADNPAALLIPPSVTPTQRRFLFKYEYQALISQADNLRDRAILEVFLQTGLTLREMAHLTISDIQLPPTISPSPEHIGTIKLNRKQKSVEVPLNWKACQALFGWSVERERLIRRHGWITSALWVSRLGDSLTPRAIRNVVKKHMAIAGIEDASPSSLRHTYATHFLVNGGNVKMVQELLGHRWIATTNVYLELVERAKREVVQKAAL